MRYFAEWFDNGHNPWPAENDGRWPKERFETYGVVDRSRGFDVVVCVTGRFQHDWTLALAIAAALNALELTPELKLAAP